MLVSRVLFTAALAAFATAAVASGLDRLSADLPELERLVPAPFRAEADRSAAVTALDRRDGVAALGSARDAVLRDPVDPDATAALASALMLAGRTDDAARTFRIAARFGWRNIQTQAFWYDAALQGGDFDVAADRLDALLRVHPRLVDEPELLKPMESDPTGRKVLAQRLQVQPAWLGEYLDVNDDTPSDVLDRRLSVLSAIDATRYPLGCEVVAPFTRVLLDNGRRSDAETLWDGNCRGQKVAGPIADPTFAQVLDPKAGSPFSWHVMASGDLSVRQVSPGQKDHSLLLENSAPGTRLTLMQTVALPAGLYRFHASQGTGAAPANGKLYLSWACNGRPPFPDTGGGDLLGTGQEVRITECDRQEIGIWLSGRASANVQSIALEKIG